MTDWERAIERARADLPLHHVKQRRTVGTVVQYTVRSRRDRRVEHVVTVVPGEPFHCTCEGGQHGAICIHKGGVALYRALSRERREWRPKVA